jgi:hypothetical protein
VKVCIRSIVISSIFSLEGMSRESSSISVSIPGISWFKEFTLLAGSAQIDLACFTNVFNSAIYNNNVSSSICKIVILRASANDLDPVQPTRM